MLDQLHLGTIAFHRRVFYPGARRKVLLIAQHVYMMGLKLEEIPTEIPYVRSDPERVAAWSQRLGLRRGRRVGLVWWGSPGHVNDSERSMNPVSLAPLLTLEDTELFSLQKDPKPGDLEQLPGVRNLGPELVGRAAETIRGVALQQF